MSDLDSKEDILNEVYSVIANCQSENILIWELIPVIKDALKYAYPEVDFKIVVEVR